jgi:uncharacterized membrane protein YphA (DoxX/SURF4 family)
MSDAAVSILSVALALVFAWAGIAKLVRYPDWTSALVAYNLPDHVRKLAAVVVPVAELSVVAFVVAGFTRVGAALTIALIAGFSFVLARARASGEGLEDGRLPCGCFGKAKARDYRLMLLRNALIGGIAAALLLSARNTPFLEGLSAPERRELLPALLGLAGVLLGGWLIYESAVSLKGRRPQ